MGGPSPHPRAALPHCARWSSPSNAALLALAAGSLIASCGEPDERALVPLAVPASAEARAPQAPVQASAHGPWLEPAEVASLPAEGACLPNEAGARGLSYTNVSGEPAKPTILEANGAGVALLDLGADGDLDAVFGQGLKRLADVVRGPGALLEVFENDGEGRFAAGPAPAVRGWWNGLAAGDVDGDGDADLVAGGYGQLLLCAQREGQLEPWTPELGGGLMTGAALAAEETRSWIVPGAEREPSSAPPLWTTSLAFLDAELDGDLDLYVCRYLDLDPLEPPRGELGEGALALPCWWKGMEVYCGPRGMTPQPDRILRGDGAGGFRDASAAWLPDHVPSFALAVGAFDADFDGDTDLYVANDSMPNLMLVNDVRAGAGAFVDHALAAGVALGADGAAEAGMGVAFGDVDRDGRMDLALTNFSDEPTHLYLARERGFSMETYRIGLANETRRLLSWSTHLVDLDGDGFLELFTANGHVYPQADAPDTGTRYAQPPAVWRLRAGATVERLRPRRRDSLLALEHGTRGSALGDVDGDGAPDLVAVAIDGPCALGMNRLAPSAARLVLHLEGDPSAAGADGRRSTRDALGAKAILVPAVPPSSPASAEFALLGEVETAAGYQSSSSPALYFGTGEHRRFAQLSVLWPSGRREELGAGAMGRELWIREGDGIVREREL